MAPQFRDRTEAGQLLAKKLGHYANRSDVVVVALPRGGVPVAYEIAQVLHVGLDICLVRKLGVPDHPELAMGAIASGGARVMNTDIVELLHISDQDVLQVTTAEQAELERRERLYRGDRPVLSVRDQTVILVDDGIATGATMRVAIAALQPQKPRWIVVATPIASPSSSEQLKIQADEMVCLAMPALLRSIGQHYRNFPQTSDQEVCQLLHHGNGV
ncbi:MAG: phosphoribosyltransferase [Drouetiella hepatica Uher 2000/2452]|uniref:Phosphoribosyltransferase n=1 Tax=Drouetiella hepatica Uher 2000/2452 TaxID=904376 RepID=A0A951QCK2_9CYAN|nr:phosphoribosyltransferase [Drouetiella hepatica Uher 2000/2452]